MGLFNKNKMSHLNHYGSRKKKKLPILRFVIPLVLGWIAYQHFLKQDQLTDSSEKNLSKDHTRSPSVKVPSLSQTKIEPSDEKAHLAMDSALAEDTLQAPSVLEESPDSLKTKATQGDAYVAMEFQKDTLLGRRIAIYLDRYQPTGAFVLLIDGETNEIQAWGQKSNGKLQENPSYLNKNTFPAASIAKTITAAAALEHNRYANHSKLPKIGNPTKLYKSQLKQPKNYKGPYASMEKAYAKSYNPIFGMIGQNLGGSKLSQTAKDLGMEQNFPGNKPKKSQYKIPDTKYGIAELASGFTESTTLSPLHAGAMFRSLVMAQPLQIPWSQHIPTQFAPDKALALPNPRLKDNTYFGMKKMMEASTTSGTARRGFNKNIYSYHRKRLITGGKTGTIDGGDPKGRYDWFAGFAQDKKDPKKKLIVVVMQHHGKIWTLRSSHFAALLINQWAKHRLK